AQEVASWDVSDPLVAKITLKAPDVVFGRLFLARLGMIPSPTAVQKYGAAYGTSPDKVVGAGPYLLQSWTKGAEMVFTRNPNYWNKPKPYLDTVTVKAISDPPTAYNSLVAGNADGWKILTQDTYNQAKSATRDIKVEPFYGPDAKDRVTDRS